MPTDEVRSVRSLHAEAMELAGDAYILRVHHGEDAMVADLYRQAASLEWRAVAQVRDVPNNQPTLRILEESARSLDAVASDLEDDHE